jgi:uncharacterized FAD-dependent dehydrogenase
MQKTLDIAVSPQEAASPELLKPILQQEAGIPLDLPFDYQIQKRSIDARGRKVKIRLRVDIFENEPVIPLFERNYHYPNVANGLPVIIVGAGPAGMFAALRLIELGLKPIILERGKDVRSRRRDIADINKKHIVNPDSNYCFGEGGAGTYSDGKLYTRSKKRGDLQRILEIFVSHGATDQILVDAHPHIGTNKLPNVVAAIRESILEAGGEIHFESRVEDFIISNSQVTGVSIAGGVKINAKAVLLATGHSARDIFRLLQRKGVHIEAKPFALGVRIEHPQSLIDSIQYHCDSRGDYLPAASYSLVDQVKLKKSQHGVFSFCMCPGGFIVPSATAPGEVVVNGMSPSRRDSRYANSGIVVSVELEHLKEFQQHKELAAMEFQASVEQKAWEFGGKTQAAPAQRLIDFVEGKFSNTLPETSYQPGLESMQMREVLPDFIGDSLRQGFKSFGQKMRGYFTNEAVIVGVESRTSSPVRIPRDPVTLEHQQIAGLFPCGEGAGYAGGIVSAAMDGERVAEQIALKMGKTVNR